MKKERLGLPPEYKKQPEYFDAFNLNDETDQKNSAIENLLREHGVKTILDMTYGTGSQVFFLGKRGYQVTGSDFSPDLLKIARKKASDQQLNVPFIYGNMPTLKAGHFDAAITIFNAVGHLKKAGFEKAMRNIARNLNPGGIYLFDILNLEAMTEDVVSNLAIYLQKKVGDKTVQPR